jgi:hypothetical protein
MLMNSVREEFSVSRQKYLTTRKRRVQRKKRVTACHKLRANAFRRTTGNCSISAAFASHMLITTLSENAVFSFDPAARAAKCRPISFRNDFMTPSDINSSRISRYRIPV